MRVIAKRTLRAFWSIPGHEDAKEPLEAWHREALQADWSDPHAVKAQFRSASILKGNRVVYVRFIGTHAAYDAIDVEAV